MEKNSKADRARQFMPFAALRGFEAMIREQTREVTPKRELSEYDAERLSKKMRMVQKGDMVCVTYYDRDAYVKLEGIVSDLDIPLRQLRVIKTVIPFDDIWDISREE
ncbi:MAG: hypothetical protein IJW49_08850 [Clostridia bacterium]|nr:hypothetical protein [Clostridia bacterium]